MKYLLIAILFYCNSIIAQDYVIAWVTVKEVGVVNYQIQIQSGNTWITKATIPPKKGIDTNRYEYTLPTADNIVRIKILMTKNISSTIPRKIVNTNVALTNLKVKYNGSSDNLSFTAINENEVSYYSVEKSQNGSTNWKVAGKLMQTGKRNYTVNIYGDGRKYRLIAVYKNGIKSEYLNFN